MKVRRNVKRRTFLHGGAGALIALPLLEAFGVRLNRAHAQAGALPQKYIAFIQPYGCYQPHFWPLLPGQSALPFDHTFGDAQDDLDPTIWRSGRTALTTTEFSLGPACESLAEHKADLLFLENLNNPVAGHWGNAPLMTGVENVGEAEIARTAGGPSVDQIIARAIGDQTRFASLEAGWLVGDGVPQMASCTWYDAAKPAAPQQDPSVFFQTVFSDVQSNAAELEALLADRRSVLDAALSDATRLRQSLGTLDRDKLDQYLEAFRSVEKRLSQTGVAHCEKPAAPRNLPDDGLARAETMIDLLAMAVACDLTRVATFQSSEGAASGAFTFPFVAGPQEAWHGMTHEYINNPERTKKQAGITSMYVKLYARLLSRLKEFGAFENAVVLYLNVSSGVHTGGNHPVIVAGSLGRHFKQGTYVRLPFSLTDHRKTNDLHVTVMQGLGMEVDKFGGAPQSGELAGQQWNRGVLQEILA